MSLFGQLPFSLILMDYSLVRQTTLLSMIWQILNGIVYHIQSMAAWVLMEYISTVTHRSIHMFRILLCGCPIGRFMHLACLSLCLSGSLSVCLSVSPSVLYGPLIYVHFT